MSKSVTVEASQRFPLSVTFFFSFSDYFCFPTPENAARLEKRDGQCLKESRTGPRLAFAICALILRSLFVLAKDGQLTTPQGAERPQDKG